MPTLGLSMIVKNAEKDLPHCLRSVREVVDQMVVVDTGSSDRTVQIATEMGATVVRMAWEDHYAKARNVALEHMTTDWVLVLDADEELAPEAALQIRSLLDGDPSIGGYQLQQRNYMRAGGAPIGGRVSQPWTGGLERAKDAAVFIDNGLVRLFRRSPGVYFRRRIHEIVEPQIVAQGLRIEPTNLVIHHYGFLAENDSRAQKDLRYMELTRLALEEEPQDSWLWLQLGLIQQKMLKDIDAAVESFRKAAQFFANNWDAWISLAEVYLDRKEYALSIEAAAHLPAEGYTGVIRSSMIGDGLFGMGRFDEARQMYQAGLNLAEADQNHTATRSDIYLQSRLGYAQVRVGMAEVGMVNLREAVDAVPASVENQERLLKALIILHREPEAAEVAESMLSHEQTEQAYCRAAALHLRVGTGERASRVLDAGIRLFPDSARLQGLRAAL